MVDLLGRLRLLQLCRVLCSPRRPLLPPVVLRLQVSPHSLAPAPRLPGMRFPFLVTCEPELIRPFLGCSSCLWYCCQAFLPDF